MFANKIHLSKAVNFKLLYKVQMVSMASARLVLGLVLVAVTQVLALQANLAGVVDWHKSLIGVPLLEPSPPSFVDSPIGKRIVAITQSNVLACLNAASGDIGMLAHGERLTFSVETFIGARRSGCQLPR
jgi:hypothetical protein